MVEPGLTSCLDELLLRFQNIDSLKRPTQRNQASMYNFLHNTRSLAESEAEWVRRGDDLAALGADREHGWFDGLAEDIMIKISRTVTTVLCTLPLDSMDV